MTLGQVQRLRGVDAGEPQEAEPVSEPEVAEDSTAPSEAEVAEGDEN